MIRPFTCVCFLLACGSGLYLYQSKHRVQMIDREIENTVRATEELREQTRVLHAEWTLLNDPQRLQALADQFLDAEDRDAGPVHQHGRPRQPAAGRAGRPSRRRAGPAVGAGRPRRPPPDGAAGRSAVAAAGQAAGGGAAAVTPPRPPEHKPPPPRPPPKPPPRPVVAEASPPPAPVVAGRVAAPDRAAADRRPRAPSVPRRHCRHPRPMPPRVRRSAWRAARRCRRRSRCRSAPRQWVSSNGGGG